MLEHSTRASVPACTSKAHRGKERGVGQTVGQHKGQRALKGVVAQQRRIQEAAQQRLLLRVACRLLPEAQSPESQPVVQWWPKQSSRCQAWARGHDPA